MWAQCFLNTSKSFIHQINAFSRNFGLMNTSGLEAYKKDIYACSYLPLEIFYAPDFSDGCWNSWCFHVKPNQTMDVPPLLRHCFYSHPDGDVEGMFRTGTVIFTLSGWWSVPSGRATLACEFWQRFWAWLLWVAANSKALSAAASWPCNGKKHRVPDVNLF